MGRSAGLRVRRRGARATRPSAAHRSQHGIVADMSTLRNIGAVEGDRVVVEAGAKWSEVLRATLAQGKTPPVLTDYLELSVGGTLVVGGVGGTTSAFGVQSDNVIELEVVTGTGRKVTCSASNNADLFDAVRAGLGQARCDHQGDAQARRGAGVGAPVPAVLPGPGNDAEGRAAAVRRQQVRRGAGRDRGRAERRHRVPAGRGEELQRARAGRQRAARRPVRRPGPAAPDDDRVLRLPQPARPAGGDAAGQRAVVLPAPVADDVHR